MHIIGDQTITHQGKTYRVDTRDVNHLARQNLLSLGQFWLSATSAPVQYETVVQDLETEEYILERRHATRSAAIGFHDGLVDNPDEYLPTTQVETPEQKFQREIQDFRERQENRIALLRSSTELSGELTNCVIRRVRSGVRGTTCTHCTEGEAKLKELRRQYREACKVE